MRDNGKVSRGGFYKLTDREMIGIRIGDNSWLSGGYTFSAQYQAVLDYDISQGFALPTPTQQILEDIYMRAMVSSGRLAKHDFFYNTITNGSLSHACVNWKSPGTFQGIPSAILPFFIRNECIMGDGSQAMFINTNFNPTINGVNYTLANNSEGVGIISNVDSSSDIDYGANDAANADRTSFLGRAGTNTSYFKNTSTVRNVVTGSSIGRWLTKRISGTIQLYRDGAQLDSTPQASTGLPNVPFMILSENNAGVSRNPSARKVTRFYGGSSLDGFEAIYDAQDAAYEASVVAKNDPDEIKILFEGDSITFGTGTTFGLSYALRTYVKLDRPMKYSNIAVPNDRSDQILARAGTWGGYLDINGVFVVFAGTNDVVQSIPTATTWANIQAIIASVQALGVTRISIGTLMDCTVYTGAQQILRANLNTLIRNNTSLGYAVMDFSANANLGTHSVTYFNDTVHPNNAGSDIMATIAATAIDTLI